MRAVFERGAPDTCLAHNRNPNASGNNIVPAHQFPRNVTWPSQLAALTLEMLVARSAVYHSTASASAQGLQQQQQ